MNSYLYLMNSGESFTESGANCFDAFSKSGKSWSEVADWDFEGDLENLGIDN